MDGSSSPYSPPVVRLRTARASGTRWRSPVDSVEPGYNPGTITITVNPHSIENFREDAYYTELDKGKLSGFGMVNTVADDCYFYYMLKRDYLAIQYAKTMPEWNGTDLTTSGGSMGGFQATAMEMCIRDRLHIVQGLRD